MEPWLTFRTENTPFSEDATVQELRLLNYWATVRFKASFYWVKDRISSKTSLDARAT